VLYKAGFLSIALVALLQTIAVNGVSLTIIAPTRVVIPSKHDSKPSGWPVGGVSKYARSDGDRLHYQYSLVIRNSSGSSRPITAAKASIV
jgi:hypothetical protein